ncbi:MAG: sulfatase [Gemmataceae bacterium]
MAARLLVLVAVCLTLPAPGAAAADRQRRNLVLLIADDLGLQLGCYGDKAAKTPNLDALARRGVRFSHAFAAVASCSPSRSTLYTGLHTHTNGQYGLAHAEHNFHTRTNVRSLPAYLRPAGYRTGIIGKTHVIPASVYDWDEEIRASGRNGAQMAKQAAKFIAGCGDKPFCLVLGYTDPHRAARGFANDPPYPGLTAQKFDPKDMPVPPFLPDTPAVRADLADYYQSVNRLDQGVGKLLDVLRQTGHDKDTLVLFLSDNGMPFPGAKTTVYDAGLRLPLIVYRPDAGRQGVVNQAMVSWVDILPTMLDYAGVARPKTLQGRSFLPVLAEDEPKGWDEVYGSHTFHEVTMYYPMRTVRTRKYRFIVNFAHSLYFPSASDLYHSPTWQDIVKRADDRMGQRTVKAFLMRPAEELYDVTADPAEVKNLAGDPAHAATLETLRKKLRDWQVQTRDPWVVKYEYE